MSSIRTSGRSLPIRTTSRARASSSGIKGLNRRLILSHDTRAGTSNKSLDFAHTWTGAPSAWRPTTLVGSLLGSRSPRLCSPALLEGAVHLFADLRSVDVAVLQQSIQFRLNAFVGLFRL